MAAFCTIMFDEGTGSALVVLDGTSADHLGKGLTESLLVEGMQRLKNLGCTQLVSYTEDESTDQLYHSIMHQNQHYKPWFKVWKAG
jgi:hypothetical protein